MLANEFHVFSVVGNAEFRTINFVNYRLIDFYLSARLLKFGGNNRIQINR